MSSTLLRRQLWLISYLDRFRTCTLEELLDAWADSSMNTGQSGFSERTFHRVREEIEENFGLVISCSKQGDKYYYQLEEGTQGRSEVRALLKRSLSMLSFVQQLDHPQLQGCVLLERLPAKQSYVEELLEAMIQSRVVSLVYKPYHASSSKRYELAPYALKVFRQRTYLLAKRLDTEQLLTFSLDRILACGLGMESFHIEADFDAEQYFAASYGIMVDPEVPVERVQLRAYGIRARYIEDLPLHSSQRELERGADWVTFELELRPTYDFLHELFGYGSEVEVLSPNWVAEELQGWAKELLARYSS